MSEMRLQRYLAMGGAAARRKAEHLITEGRVKVNGVIVRELGTKVETERDSVTVDDESVYPKDFFYILLNKPKACITAVTDDQGRATVMDFLPNLPVPVKPVGRLDYYSEGVLLLTNDGELAARLLAPESHVGKTYHVKVKGILRKRELDLLATGVRIDDGSTTMPAEVMPLPSESKHSWVQLTLYQGKSRQIHRMMEALGFEVTKLQRVSFGNLTFHGMRVGDARELKQDELNELRALVGLGRSAGARGKWTAFREDTDVSRRARKRVRDEAEAKLAAANSIDHLAAGAAAPGAPARREAAQPSRRDERGAGRPVRGGRGDARGPRVERGAAAGPRGGRGDARGPRVERGAAAGPRGGRGDARGPRVERGAAAGPRGGRGDARGPRVERGAAAGPRGGRGDARGPRVERGAAAGPRGGRGDASPDRRGARGPAGGAPPPRRASAPRGRSSR